MQLRNGNDNQSAIIIYLCFIRLTKIQKKNIFSNVQTNFGQMYLNVMFYAILAILLKWIGT